MTDPAVNYLTDVLSMLITSAIEAKLMRKEPQEKGSDRDAAFQEGRALAYYEVVSTLINQAAIFGLSKDTIPALDFDPDKILLS